MRNSFIGQFWRLIILVIIFYIIFNISRSVNSNYQINKTIEEKKIEVGEQKELAQILKNKNLYYQTEVYKEIEARSKLGMKKPDEKMVIVPENSDDKTIFDSNIQSAQSESKENMTNYSLWWKYIVGKQ